MALLFHSVATYPLYALLLPAFLDQQLGYSYVSIGLAFLLYNVVAALVAMFTLRTSLSVGRVVVQSLIGLSTTFLLANSGYYFFAPFLILAVARGLEIGFVECIITKAAKNRQTSSIDIGLLIVPTRLAEFASILAAGFIAQSVGYGPAFAVSGICFVIFSVFSLYLLKTN